MGLFDFFGGGTPAEKAQRLKPKVTQKFGEATNRQKAITEVIKLASPDAVPVLMARFTITVDPQTTDRSEKEEVFDAICAMGEAAMPHVIDFLKRNDASSSWPMKIAERVLSADKSVGIALDELARLGAEYTRDPEKKEVLLRFLSEKSDPRIGPAVLPFLHDMSDDVKMAALHAVGVTKPAEAREGLVSVFLNAETAMRVKLAALEALAAGGYDCQSQRAQLEPHLLPGWSLEKTGTLKKKGTS
jgi:HEAT repeat protein